MNTRMQIAAIVTMSLMMFNQSAVAVELDPSKALTDLISQLKAAIHDAIAQAGAEARETLRDAEARLNGTVDKFANSLSGIEGKTFADLQATEKQAMGDINSQIETFQRDVASKDIKAAALIASQAESTVDRFPFINSTPAVISHRPMHLPPPTGVRRSVGPVDITFIGSFLDQGLDKNYPKLEIPGCAPTKIKGTPAFGTVDFLVDAACFPENPSTLQEVSAIVRLWYKTGLFGLRSHEISYPVTFQALPMQLGQITYSVVETHTETQSGPQRQYPVTRQAMAGGDTDQDLCLDVPQDLSAQGYSWDTTSSNVTPHETQCYDAGTNFDPRHGESSKVTGQTFFFYHHALSDDQAIYKKGDQICFAARVHAPEQQVDCRLTFTANAGTVRQVSTTQMLPEYPKTVQLDWYKGIASDNPTPLPPGGSIVNAEISLFDGRDIPMINAKPITDTYFDETLDQTTRFTLNPKQFWLSEWQ